MEKIIKKLFIFMIIAVSLVFIYPINADALTAQTPYASTKDNTDSLSTSDIASNTPSKNSQYYDYYDYVIDKYDIDIIVNENNTLDITENITAYFNIPKHGISRTIPVKNTITRLDGTKSTNHAQVTNLNVDSEYTTSKEKRKL